jgi:hypothetical protein
MKEYTFTIPDNEGERTIELYEQGIEIIGEEDGRDGLIGLNKDGAILLAKEILKYYGVSQ